MTVPFREAFFPCSWSWKAFFATGSFFAAIPDRRFFCLPASVPLIVRPKPGPKAQAVRAVAGSAGDGKAGDGRAGPVAVAARCAA